jgi:uncharacterized membrane protein
MKKLFLILMSIFYIVAGFNHFKNPQFYLDMMPPYLPAHAVLNMLAGVIEIILGIGLLFVKSRRASAWGIIALLIAIFPANIYMYTNNISPGGTAVPEWAALLRLPFQLVFIGWAYVYTKPLKRD